MTATPVEEIPKASKVPAAPEYFLGRGGLGKSRFFIAFLAFLALCQIWARTGIFVAAPTDYPYKSWTAADIEDFITPSGPRPNVAFVGSSLMLVPLGATDANYLNTRVGLPRHHRSYFFEDNFKQKTGRSITTYDFALPGEMPSDAYLIEKFLLKDDKRPDVLVCGVGPRDFMDNLLPSPEATDPYKFLARFGDVSNHIDLIAPDPWERLNWELGRLFYPYQHKEDIVLSANHLAYAGIFSLVQEPDEKKSIIFRRTLLPYYRTFEVVDGDGVYKPDRHPVYSDANLEEYRKRYRNLKWDTFLSQMTFLADMLNVARSRGTHVVIVAMPITDINRDLLGDMPWSAYKTTLKVLALAKGATYIDMAETTSFDINDFGDTVHLHSVGGEKMLRVLADKMAQDDEVRTALRITGAQPRAVANRRKDVAL